MKRIIGVDYGDKRMGIAISDPLGMFATPLRTVPVKSMEESRDELLKIVDEFDAGLIVIGMPFNMNGTSGEMVGKVTRFIEMLKLVTTVPIKTIDERLSSQLVEKSLIEADMRRNKRKTVIDKLAAQVILQSYMDMME